VHLDPLLLALVENFINAALSKSWIEAQPLLHSWSLDERGRLGENERESSYETCMQGNSGSEQNAIQQPTLSTLVF
jgi:hypothetical protein